MGIKKFSSFTSQKKAVIVHQSLYDFRKSVDKDSNIKIAVDVYYYLHRFIYTYNDHLMGFVYQIIKLLSNKIIPVYIFDGTPPKEKSCIIKGRFNKKKKMKEEITKITKEIDNVTTKRFKKTSLSMELNKLKKKSVRINQKHITELKKVFDMFGICYMNAIGEADSLCAKLYETGHVNACLSNDMDILVHGCKRLIKFDRNLIIEYDTNYILKTLNITEKEFMNLCLLLGCDYIRPIPKTNPSMLYRLIKQYGSIDKVIKILKTKYLIRFREQDHEETIKNYQTAKNIYLQSKNVEYVPPNFNIKIDKEIDVDELIDFLKAHSSDYKSNGKHRSNIDNGIKRINEIIKNGLLI